MAKNSMFLSHYPTISKLILKNSKKKYPVLSVETTPDI